MGDDASGLTLTTETTMATMATETNPKREILDLLVDCRRAAGEPKMGTREIEVVTLLRPWPSHVVFAALKNLRATGAIVRSGGFVWITEEQYARENAAHASHLPSKES